MSDTDNNNVLVNIMEESKKFRNTSFFIYLKDGDWKNVWRKIRSNIYYPLRRTPRNVLWWFLYRTFYRVHILDSGLPPGYHDKDELMIHSCFQLLVNYVEDELAWMQFISFHETRDSKPWWLSDKFYVKNNAREFALKYLGYWETQQPNESNGTTEEELKRLRKKDKTIKNLYLWWKDSRPIRKDPYENWKNRDQHSWSNAWKIEQMYAREDQKMLFQLINIRQGLWT